MAWGLEKPSSRRAARNTGSYHVLRFYHWYTIIFFHIVLSGSGLLWDWFLTGGSYVSSSILFTAGFLDDLEN